MFSRIKIIILIVGALLIIGLIVFLVYKNEWLIPRQPSRPADQPTQELMERKEPYTSDYQKVKKGVLEKNIKYCDELEVKENKDYCIHKIATLNNLSNFCEKIKDETLKINCDEIIVSRQAVKEDDYSTCLNITNEDLKKQCLAEIFKKKDNINECLGFAGDIKELCESIIYSNLAFKNNNSGYCEQVKIEVYKNNCFLVVKSIPKDSDDDGLSDADELSYGTNPFSKDTDNDDLSDIDELKKYHTNPRSTDTDNDGYSDGDEIKSGYNPSGEGKLDL